MYDVNETRYAEIALEAILSSVLFSYSIAILLLYA